MKTRLIRISAFVLVIVLLVIAPFANAQEGPAQVGIRPDAPPYALHGPYWVGTMEIMIDPETESELPIRAWYPALNPEMALEAITYMVRTDAAFRIYTDPDRPLPSEGHALLNADPNLSAGPYPLVVLSHSYTCFSECQYFLAEHLASYGFVVLSPEHRGDTWELIAAPTIRRILEVNAVIAYAESATATEGELAGLVDMEHIAVGGWSSGGAVTYGAANAPLSWAGYEEYCAVIPEGFGCANMDNERAAALAAAGLETEPEGLWPAIGDPRVDAIVPMAGGGDLHGQRSLAELAVPMLALYGSNDTDASWFSLTYDQIASPQKAQVIFEGANHFIFGADCEAEPWVAEIGAYEWCSDSVWDKDRAHDLINHFVTAFLLSVLKGDTDATDALAPDAVAFPGITYEATGF